MRCYGPGSSCQGRVGHESTREASASGSSGLAPCPGRVCFREPRGSNLMPTVHLTNAYSWKGH